MLSRSVLHLLCLLQWQADSVNTELPGNPKWKLKCYSLGPVQLFANPWTVALQILLSMGFSRQEYWSGLPFPFPGDLPDSGIELTSPALRANSLQSGLPGKPKVQPTDFQILSGKIFSHSGIFLYIWHKFLSS